MLVNVAGLAAATLLTLTGVWLAFAVSDLRHNQDCALSGRRDCAPIVAAGQFAPASQH